LAYGGLLEEEREGMQQESDLWLRFVYAIPASDGSMMKI
jgi:hypothetical protein